MRVKIQLRCDECRRKNYASTKNKKNTTAKLALRKYCPFCGKHVAHRETK
jgi:large subunit ribosomal protein L33